MTRQGWLPWGSFRGAFRGSRLEPFRAGIARKSSGSGAVVLQIVTST